MTGASVEQWDGIGVDAGVDVGLPDALRARRDVLGRVVHQATVCMVTGGYTQLTGVAFVATATLAEQVNGSDWTVGRRRQRQRREVRHRTPAHAPEARRGVVHERRRIA